MIRLWGPFLGGIVLADSEFRHQIEADIAPFKGLLLGIFFVAVGASISLGFFVSQPVLTVGVIVGFIVIKFLVLWILARVFGFDPSACFLFAFALAQGDEFAFVLFPSTVTLGVLSDAWSDIFVLTVAISMALTPFLLMIDQKLVQPRFIKPKVKSKHEHQQEKESEVLSNHENEHGHAQGHEASDVLIIGFGRFGNIVGRFLMANEITTTILDFDAEQIDTISKLGLKAYYGDATRLAILRTVGADKAKLLLIMIDNEAATLHIVDLAKKHFPHVKILARARDRSHASRLMKKGVQHVYHEMVGSALHLSLAALEELGHSPEHAREVAQILKEHEYKMIRDLANFEGQGRLFPARPRTYRNAGARDCGDAGSPAERHEEKQKSGCLGQFLRRVRQGSTFLHDSDQLPVFTAGKTFRRHPFFQQSKLGGEQLGKFLFGDGKWRPAFRVRVEIKDAEDFSTRP